MDIRVTESAKSKLFEMGVSEDTFLRIGVKSGGCSGNTYDAVLDGNMSEVDEVYFSEKYNFWKPVVTGNTGKSGLDSSKNMVGIACIVERNYAEPIAKAAILAGSAGPTVSFAEGRGLRDKIRLLRIAKTAEKEIVIVVVEEIDVDLV